jgi:hypothetical protein
MAQPPQWKVSAGNHATDFIQHGTQLVANLPQNRREKF